MLLLLLLLLLLLVHNYWGSALLSCYRMLQCLWRHFAVQPPLWLLLHCIVGPAIQAAACCIARKRPQAQPLQPPLTVHVCHTLQLTLSPGCCHCLAPAK